MTRTKNILLGSIAILAFAGMLAEGASAEPNLAAAAKPTVVAASDSAKQQPTATKGEVTPAKPPLPASSAPSTAKKTAGAKKSSKPVSRLLARFSKTPEAKETKAPVPASEVATTAPKAKPKRVNMKSVNGLIGTGMGYGCRYVRALCGSGTTAAAD